MGDRFIDEYEVLLLDMGNTFMFNSDRFDDEQDYHATYVRLGGSILSPEQVRRYITDSFERMLTAARTPSRVDDFGSIRRFLPEAPGVSALPPEELERLVAVFSEHECGTIPRTHARVLHTLRESHPLGLVSNVWAPSSVFDRTLAEAGVRDLFTIRVWSSDFRSIKPSKRLFKKALDAFDVDSSHVVYIGDNPRRDVAGAKAMGMGAVWIENEVRPLTPEIPGPDLIISDLTELPTAPRNGNTTKPLPGSAG